MVEYIALIKYIKKKPNRTSRQFSGTIKEPEYEGKSKRVSRDSLSEYF